MSTSTRKAPPAPPRSTAEQLVGKIPFRGKVQLAVYSSALIQWAVGIATAAYILLTQANYFGRTNKPVWDGLNHYLHFSAVPWVGTFLDENWELARHLYFRNLQETVLAYAFVAMIVVKLQSKRLKSAKIPWVHRAIVKLGMPSPYQGQLGRHPDTSGLQYLFLIPSMVLCELPGLLVASAVIFGSMAVGHRLGFHPAWFYPEGTITVLPGIKVPWVQIVLGLVAGRFFGRLPAIKAGQDIQRRYLDMRLAVAYYAVEIMRKYKVGALSEDEARDKLTELPDTRPSDLYPASYRKWYDSLLREHAPARPRTRVTTVMSRLTVALAVVLGAYGIYAQRWGIPHNDLWIP